MRQLLATAVRVTENATVGPACIHGVPITIAMNDGVAHWKGFLCPACRNLPPRHVHAAIATRPVSAKPARNPTRTVGIRTHSFPLTAEPVITATTYIHRSEESLRDAMYVAFHGKCQICHGQVDRSGMEVDHIFPVTRAFEEIRLELIARGHGTAETDAFLAGRWNGTHDCFLNYTLMCKPCNIKKTNDIFHVIALEALFAYTAKQAAEVIAYVNARSR
jgi:5-methylcytosine-specific restriction endonuclease McrA